MKQITSSNPQHIPPGIYPATSPMQASQSILSQSSAPHPSLDDLSTTNIHPPVLQEQSLLNFETVLSVPEARIAHNQSESVHYNHWILGETLGTTLDQRTKLLLSKLPTHEITEKLREVPKLSSLISAPYVDLVETIIEAHHLVSTAVSSHKSDTVFNNHQLIGSNQLVQDSYSSKEAKAQRSKKPHDHYEPHRQEYRDKESKSSPTTRFLNTVAKSLKQLARSLERLAV